MARDCWRAGAARRAPPPPPFLAQDRIFYRRECQRSCESRVLAADHDRKPSGAVTDWSGMRATSSVCSLPRLRGRVGEGVSLHIGSCLPPPCPASRSRIYPTSASSYMAELG